MDICKVIYTHVNLFQTTSSATWRIRKVDVDYVIDLCVHKHMWIEEFARGNSLQFYPHSKQLLQLKSLKPWGRKGRLERLGRTSFTSWQRRLVST